MRQISLLGQSFSASQVRCLCLNPDMSQLRDRDELPGATRYGPGPDRAGRVSRPAGGYLAFIMNECGGQPRSLDAVAEWLIGQPDSASDVELAYASFLGSDAASADNHSWRHHTVPPKHAMGLVLEYWTSPVADVPAHGRGVISGKARGPDVCDVSNLTKIADFLRYVCSTMFGCFSCCFFTGRRCQP